MADQIADSGFVGHVGRADDRLVSPRRNRRCRDDLAATGGFHMPRGQFDGVEHRGQVGLDHIVPMMIVKVSIAPSGFR